MNLKNKKILITGGTGFIGSHLVEELHKKGAVVTIINKSLNKSANTLPPQVKVIKIKLPDPKVSQILNKNNFYALFHMAGNSYVPSSVKHPIKDFKSNAELTLRLLEQIHKNSPQTKVIFASSAAVYGNPINLPIKETHPLEPISPYGISKLAAEKYINIYANIYGLKTASLRSFSVYGPYQKKLVIFDIINKLYNNPKKISLHGTGEETRDFVYVKDVVQASLLVLSQGKMRGEVYNVASGRSTKIKTLVKIIIKAIKINPKVEFTGQTRTWDPIHWKADISHLKSLGFKPKFNLKTGIQKLLYWYEQ